MQNMLNCALFCYKYFSFLFDHVNFIQQFRLFLFCLQRHSTGGVMVGKSTNITNRHSCGPNSSVTIPVKIWHCPACTYENSSASVVCDICSSPRGLASGSKSSNDMSSLRSIDGNGVIETSVDLSRKESKLMENLRKKEESEARNKWENIIQYCKDVSISV